MLAREREPAEYREALETCLTAAQQMRRLTESLLQLAQIKHVKVFPDLAPEAASTVGPGTTFTVRFPPK